MTRYSLSRGCEGVTLRLEEKYGRECDISYSNTKCKVIKYNRTGGSQWVQGNSMLQAVDKYSYLGLKIKKEGVGLEKKMKKLMLE